MASKAPRMEGQKALNILRLASAGKGTETVTIGADVFELTTFDDARVTAGRIAVDLHGGGTTKAQGTLTFTTQPADGDTVVIDGKTYTFQATLTNVDGHVYRGASATEARDNLVAAIMGSAGAGTLYAAATTPHTTVKAAASGGNMVATALQGGTAGNSLATTKTSTHIAWDAATLGTTTAGVDPTNSEVGTALAAAINASGTQGVTATKISATELQIIAKVIGPKTTACTETLAGSNNAWAAAAMYGGADRAFKREVTLSRVPTAVEVALGSLRFELDFTPTQVLVLVRTTATPGVLKAWDGAITISTSHVSIDNSGSTDWAATDTVEVRFIE